jgi:hypothetical protein
MGDQTNETADDRELPIVQISLDKEIRTYTPEKLAGLFFEGVKHMVEDFMGREVSDTILTFGLASTDLERVCSLWLPL